MAKSLCLKTAIADAFGAFKNNWMILLAAGAIASCGFLLDQHTTQHFSSARQFFKEELTRSANSQEFWDKTKVYFKDLAAQENKGKNGFLVLVMSLILLYLHLGLMNICLAIASKKKASLDMFYVPIHSLLSVIGAWVLVSLITGALVVLGMFGIAALGWFQLPNSLMVLFGFAGFVLLAVFLVRYWFVSWCVLDQNATMGKALSASAKIVSGNTGKILALMIFMWAFLGLGSEVLMLIINPVSRMIPLPGLDYVLIHMITLPVFFMGWTSAYKQIK